MRVLLDTNVIIHREAYKASHLSIGQLFRWLDELKCTKCIHPVTEAEIKSHANQETVKSMGIKLESYYTDNALVNKVDEVYLTIFENTPEQLRPIELLEEWGFYNYGIKTSLGGVEKVYCRQFSGRVDKENPKLTFPFMSASSNVFFVPIWPGYHTELLPDSILNTESPEEYKDNEPYRNAISKVYKRVFKNYIRTIIFDH